MAVRIIQIKTLVNNNDSHLLFAYPVLRCLFNPMMTTRLPALLFCLAGLFPLQAIGEANNNSTDQTQSLNIYSFRKTDLIAPILDNFTEQYGIQVNVISGKADRLMDRLRADGMKSQADLLLTSDVTRLEQAKIAGLLQPLASEFLTQHVPRELRDSKGYWFGISVRARAIFYARNKVSAEAIASYQDLATPQWQGKVCVRKGSHIYNRSMLAGFIARMGEPATERWVSGLVANLAVRPNGGDRDQLRKLNQGICDLALANSYYYGMLSASENEQDRQVYENVGVIWPDQDQYGTHINISGAAITAASSHQASAKLFIEFLLTEEAQQIYAQSNYEYPVRADVKASELVRSWGKAKFDYASLPKLNYATKQAQALALKYGW